MIFNGFLCNVAFLLFLCLSILLSAFHYIEIYSFDLLVNENWLCDVKDERASTIGVSAKRFSAGAWTSELVLKTNFWMKSPVHKAKPSVKLIFNQILPMIASETEIENCHVREKKAHHVVPIFSKIMFCAWWMWTKNRKKKKLFNVHLVSCYYSIKNTTIYLCFLTLPTSTHDNEHKKSMFDRKFRQK